MKPDLRPSASVSSALTLRPVEQDLSVKVQRFSHLRTYSKSARYLLLSEHQLRQKTGMQLQLFQYPAESLDLLPLTICGILHP
jgi:hypothetical protein